MSFTNLCTDEWNGGIHIPSRTDNPFATCWTRPGAVAYQFGLGQSIEQIIDLLAANHWRGAIVGPHGSGKSTLLETLKPAFAAVGFQFSCITLRKGQVRLPRGSLGHSSTVQRNLLMIDGYEQLSYIERVRVMSTSFQRRMGLLVTSHARTILPTIFRTSPDAETVNNLVLQLTSRLPSPITSRDVAASFACHGSNVREILFDLYDRHERISRFRRTLSTNPA